MGIAQTGRHLKEVSSVFEKCQFLVALFSFGKESHFMQKVLVFGRMSDKIMLCKLWGKVKSVFFNINFAAKMCFRKKKKKKKYLGEMLIFHQVRTNSESDYLFAKHACF